MTVLGALASRADRPSNAIQATPWGDWGDGGTATYAGTPVSVSNATNLLTVYGCNRFICDGISTLPIDVYGPAGEVDPPGWLAQPTPDLDFISWATQVITSWLLAGNAYVLPVYGRREVQSVHPLDPTKVVVRRENGRKVFAVNERTYTSAQVFHSPGVMFPGADIGLSPVGAAMQMIGSGMAAEEFAGRQFGQGLTMSGVIEVPGELEPLQARKMARSFAEKHGGKSKTGLPGVLQGGAQWKPTGVTNEQAQFLETRGFTASQIAAEMFLIDPAEMGLPVTGTSLTYANLEQRNARKVQVTFLPWIVRLEKLINSLLPVGQYVKLNVNALLRGDTKTRFDAYRVALGPDVPFMEANEARAFEDWPPMQAPPEEM